MCFVIVFTTNLIISTRHCFSIAFVLGSLSAQNWMPDHTDKINLDIFVCDDQNVERRLWSCLGQTCSMTLLVFCPNFLYYSCLFAVAFGFHIWPRLVTNLQFE